MTCLTRNLQTLATFLWSCDHCPIYSCACPSPVQVTSTTYNYRHQSSSCFLLHNYAHITQNTYDLQKQDKKNIWVQRTPYTKRCNNLPTESTIPRSTLPLRWWFKPDLDVPSAGWRHLAVQWSPEKSPKQTDGPRWRCLNQTILTVIARADYIWFPPCDSDSHHAIQVPFFHGCIVLQQLNSVEPPVLGCRLLLCTSEARKVVEIFLKF